MDASDDLLRKAYPSALVTLGGVVRRLNAPMATALGKPAVQCVGRDFAALLPAGQRVSAERLVAQGATGRRLAMNVLEFPGPGGASVVFLVEARLAEDSAGGERLVWVHSLDSKNDLASLLIPFRLAAKAAGLGLWMYSPADRQLEWIGGAPAMAALFPNPTVALSRVIARVHPDDQKALRRLMLPTSAQSPWIELRFRTDHSGWHHLACQARRVDLGHGGPELTFGVVRDDTEQKGHKQDMQAALTVEQERADLITDFSSALITATTEQRLRQVVLTRLATTFEGAGALLALIDEDRSLRVSTDAGISPEEADCLHGLSLDDPDPVSEAIRTGKPQVIGSQEDYVRRWPHGAALSWVDLPSSGRAALITPLGRVDGQPLGAWAVIYDRDCRPSLDERALMDTLAGLASQALGRVRAQEAYVDLATAVQSSMLPTLPPHLPGLEVAARYRPSRKGLDIGGDWYDAFVLPDGAVGLEIGDVQGHDVDAAAFMGQIRASMRTIAAHEPAPGTVLSRINELLVTMDAPRFASCTMLHIDGDGQVTGTSGGHVPMLCAHEDGSHEVLKLPGGPVLGVVRDTGYSEKTFALDQDSALVLVTDGVVEGPGLTLDDGLERAGTLAAEALQEGLSTEATADRVLEAADAVDHLDDLAVLVIRRS
ncbi:PAS fold-containing protein [Actinacidiphila paucisporea]|uniref:PAS fold-containing protein n=2 Tax=Actinacidiphila paucisporea TaxID=310782 RepID=A0A1M7QVQ3_9ACTN|nr:PAS fold-containing protein [Actinacidiphila paucisporea]